jgi:hypothetical protein
LYHVSRFELEEVVYVRMKKKTIVFYTQPDFG